MKYNYSFWYGDKFIGSMVLGSNGVAIDVANGCGATSFENDITETTFKKCSVCHEWHETKHLNNGVCYMCGYLERLKDFINYCESELDNNWEDKS